MDQADHKFKQFAMTLQNAENGWILALHPGTPGKKVYVFSNLDAVSQILRDNIKLLAK